MGITAVLERYGPVGLVPLAWGFVGAALFTPLVDERTLLIGLGVMTAIFAVFVAHPAMGEGLLGVWRAVLAGGFGVNVVALAALLVAAVPRSLAAVSLVGWLLFPTVGLAVTGRRAAAGGWYRAFAAASGVGAALFGAALLAGGRDAAVAGLGLLAAAQTASVALAAAQNDG